MSTANPTNHDFMRASLWRCGFVLAAFTAAATLPRGGKIAELGLEVRTGIGGDFAHRQHHGRQIARAPTASMAQSRRSCPPYGTAAIRTPARRGRPDRPAPAA